MAFSQSELTAIEAAIASGSLSVKYQDRSVTYRSLDDMLRIRDLMRRELGVTSGRNTRLYAEHKRGTESGGSDDDC
jgi:hypothetical protein